MMKLPSRTTSINLAIFLLAAVLITLFMPRPDRKNFNYELNRPWSNPPLLSVCQVPIYPDAETKKHNVDSVKHSFVPVYSFDTSSEENIRNKVNASSLAPADKKYILDLVAKIYKKGVVEQETADSIASHQLSIIKIQSENTRRTYDTKGMVSSRRAYVSLDSTIFAQRPTLSPQFRDLNISGAMRPNIIKNEEESERIFNEQIQSFEVAVGVIQQGERIIDRGEIVTPQLFHILETYRAELDRQDREKGKSGFNVMAGKLLFAIFLMGALYCFLLLYRPADLKRRSRFICLLSLIVVFFAVTALMYGTFDATLYLMPFAIIPIVLVVFYDTFTAIFVLLLEVLLCAAFAPSPFEFYFVEIVAGLTAIFTTKELSKRSQLLRTSLYVFGAYLLSYWTVELMQVGTSQYISLRLIGYLAINMVLTSFAYILIFVIEKVFGFISVVTLVELADINNPVLRRLSEECPGTFQHSMTVSNLVSSAANAVGANVQLARAGALYHDIGKIKNPAFFTENQHGVNPHDALSPRESARVIISHVTEGIKLAEKENLPRVIRDMIVQHHGSTTARYFYTTYCNAHPDEEVDPAPFTYPGPNPQTKEASLLMMADVVEAASRSLPDHKPETITAMVNRLIDAQVAAGLHKDSPLSFRDITAIKKAFIDSLTTMYHTRIAYPKPIK